MKITVTTGDIKRGIRVNCCRCPVALAINRAMRLRTRYVAVGDYGFTLLSAAGKHVRSFRLPRRATNFIRRFDARKSVRQFTFDIP